MWFAWLPKALICVTFLSSVYISILHRGYIGDIIFGTKSRVCGTKIKIIKEITLFELIKIHLRKGVCQNGLFRTI